MPSMIFIFTGILFSNSRIKSQDSWHIKSDPSANLFSEGEDPEHREHLSLQQVVNVGSRWFFLIGSVLELVIQGGAGSAAEKVKVVDCPRVMGLLRVDAV